MWVLYLIVILSGIVPPTAIGLMLLYLEYRLSRKTLDEATAIRVTVEKDGKAMEERVENQIRSLRYRILGELDQIETKFPPPPPLDDVKINRKQLDGIKKELRETLIGCYNGKMGAEVKELMNDDGVREALAEVERSPNMDPTALINRVGAKLIDKYL